MDQSEENNQIDGEEEEEEDDGSIVIEIDERTMYCIIRVQALIRGFLTRKLIYEHLQQMVQQNELNQQFYGEEDNEEVLDGEEIDDPEQQMLA
jgi:hypothetical protein